MATKRPRDEEEEEEEFDVSSLPSGSYKNKTVCGVPINVSPVKSSSRNPNFKYFDGQLSDGVKTVRMVCFDSKKRAVMETAMLGKSAVSLKHCGLKESAGRSEVIASHHTKVEMRPERHFDLAAIIAMDVTVDLSEISNLKDIVTGQKVTMKAKVVQTNPPVTVTTNDGRSVSKQECMCADAKDSSRLVLWEKLIDTLEVGSSYIMKNLTVRSFEGNKYLSSSMKCEFEKCDDIGDVSSTTISTVSEEPIQFTGEVVGIAKLDVCQLCVICKTGRLSRISSILGKCLKCESIVKYDKCKKVASQAVLLLEDTTSHNTVKANVPSNLVLQIMKEDSWENVPIQGVEEKILMAPRMVYTVIGGSVTKVE